MHVFRVSIIYINGIGKILSNQNL
uniref:Uncharacterized protein n=1 Tax=Arundo donax TaxID=35708 RepID=A0A0A8XYP5_ARUDO